MNKQDIIVLVAAICRQESALADSIGLSLRVHELYHIYNVFALADSVTPSVRAAATKLGLTSYSDIRYVQDAVRCYHLESLRK